MGFHISHYIGSIGFNDDRVHRLLQLFYFVHANTITVLCNTTVMTYDSYTTFFFSHLKTEFNAIQSFIIYNSNVGTYSGFLPKI